MTALRAFILKTGLTLEPFGDAPSQALFAASTVGEAVTQALQSIHAEVIYLDAIQNIPAEQRNGPCLLLADHCYVSRKCLQDFYKQAALSASSGAQTQRLALRRTPSVDYTRPVSSVEIDSLPTSLKPITEGFASKPEAAATEICLYDCFYLPAGLRELPSEAQSTPLAVLAYVQTHSQASVVDKKELGIPVRLPLLSDGQRAHMVLPITSTVAAHVEHWVHVLWLSHLGFGIRWLDTLRQRPLWVAWRVLRSVPWNMPQIMRNLVSVGKNVSIHPTAHVEASIIGDNVTIGPKACVRNSIVGNHVSIGDHANVLSSTLGDRSHVTPRTFLVWSAVYPDAVINNYKLQVSVVGQGATISTWAGLIDAKFQGAIDVMHRGQRFSTERSFLGSCIGHGAAVGAKVLLLPGRAVPNRTFIAMRPDELVRDIPSDLPKGEPVARHQGTLVPLRELLSQNKSSTSNVPEKPVV